MACASSCATAPISGKLRRVIGWSTFYVISTSCSMRSPSMVMEPHSLPSIPGFMVGPAFQ
jgi:hypothetical protein